jgi:hypothetical protein
MCTHQVRSLYHLTRSLDRSRPVVSNDGWEHARTDLCTIHDYGSPEDLRVRGIESYPLMPTLAIPPISLSCAKK